MVELVVYRDFGDGTEEIGVLTIEHDGAWVDVGDFVYCLAWNKFDWPFTIIGVL